MSRHPEQTRARIAQTSSRLRSLGHAETIAPDSLTVAGPTGREGWEAARGLGHRPAEIGEEFGPRWATYWFRIGATVPEHWRGSRVDLLWDAGSEATLWRDGEVLQGLYSGWRALRTTAPLIETAGGGEPLALEVEMACNSWAGDDPEPDPGVDPARAARYRLGRNWSERPAASAPRHVAAPARLVHCAIGRFDPEAWRLAWDLELLRLLELEPGLEPDWSATLLDRLNAFCNTWDAGDRRTWEPAGAILSGLLARGGAAPRHRAVVVGHAHVDTAWVWPVAETRRKLVRSTANQLALMDRYPEHRFAASSAQHYAWLESDAPELFARLAERVAEGRWEVVGGSWVEPDCNLPDGESLLRQLLVGQRWFEQRFGRRCEIYWSPDTFGHNGQMPQLLRQAGIGRFVTQKLSWNQFARPPHDSFRWRGIDGSEVVAHLPPVGTYNAELEPAELRAAAAAFRDHDRCADELVLFGHGDGGGGPTPEMLERAARMRDLRGLPAVEIAAAGEFFAGLEAVAGELEPLVGQLYFEYHRGTYTSQARTKRGNRAGERALHEAETASAIAWARGLADYPAGELDRLWPILLRNQFHDILPGTSLAEVYETTEAEHAELIEAATALRDRAVAALASPAAGEGAPLNLNGFGVHAVVDGPAGPRMFECPALGFGREVAAAAGVSFEEDGERLRLANGAITAELDRGGRLTALRLGEGPELLAGAGNVFELYEDRPTAFDAWELEPYLEQTRRETDAAESWTLELDDPLRVELAFRHRIGEASTLEQRLRLDAEATRLEVRCRIDWRERNRLLRVAFPLRIEAVEATLGAQFGVHRLPTHRNTDADLARFEAPALGFADLSEHGRGAALLSPTNYGFSADGGTLRLSLLRAPTDPDPEADQGEHELAYAIQLHEGTWQEAGLARAALAFERPPLAVAGATSGAGFAALDSDDLILDTLKRSEDGRDLVLRLHEAHGGRGLARLRLGFDHGPAVLANALEDPADELERDGDALLIPYRPFELITIRVAPGRV